MVMKITPFAEPGKPGMPIVENDVVALCHLPEFHRWLLLLGNGSCFPFGYRREKRQRLVSECLDRPESIAPLQSKRRAKGIRLRQFHQRRSWNA
jgi:hypothetical protein